jgi:UDP-N-acetylglucosamine--N-acetylmuramyl-(pentapeptide) pyrophosphoryl-undecaprenol N-acetylglucosamine transferase
MKVVIAAAGTAGHVYPALAVGEALVDAGLDRSDVAFFGGDRIESTVVPDAGFPFLGFRLARLRRSLSVSNLGIPFVVAATVREMRREVERLDPQAVLGMGGYVTVPAALAARRARRPFVVHEQNAAPGLAARFAARFADRVLLGLPDPAGRLRGAEVVGNPLGDVFAGFDRARLRPEALARYGAAADLPVLGVVGGSLGAGVLNGLVADLVASWQGPAITIVHLTGPEWEESVAEQAERSPLPWRCRGYEDRMDLFYAAADLVVCRAGAMTVSELAATGTPAILVPLERVGQGANAAALTDAGAGIVVSQREVGRVVGEAARLLGDPAERAGMAGAAARLALPGAAASIAATVVEVAGE